jgi:hypothetical protein
MLILKSENNYQSDAAELLSNLEKCRKEYENLKYKIDFEMIKETIN